MAIATTGFEGRLRHGATFSRVATPVLFDHASRRAIALARIVAAGQVRLTGLVPLAEGDSVSGAAASARRVRECLRELADGPAVRARATVLVTTEPWADFRETVADDDADLLIIEVPEHLDALGITASRVLDEAPCDVAMLRGEIPPRPGRVLVPIRGGPHAELSLRLALGIGSHTGAPVAVLHLRQPGMGTTSDAAFTGIAQVLAGLPDVESLERATDAPAHAILDEIQPSDVVVLGTTAQRGESLPPLGAVAERVLAESRAPVIAVKTRRSMPLEPTERVGQKAISILVDRWFAENTYHADEFADLQQLVNLKRELGTTVSLALPALDEEHTVGRVIETLKHALAEKVPLLDEIVLIDSNSSDRTREIAAGLGIPVFIHQEVLPQYGARKGKGEALWKSLHVTTGDIVLWIDTDIVNIHPRFVYGLLGPLLFNPRIMFVKGYYRRPLRVGKTKLAGQGGRVTEIAVRPLFNLYYPELSGFVQPLSGEYGGRRSALEQVSFCSGYGVEAGLLIDIFEKFGLFSMGQVDLLERIHRNQTLEALSKMSFAIIQVIMSRLDRRAGTQLLRDINRTMKLVRDDDGRLSLGVEEIVEQERPPVGEIPEYRMAHPR